MIVGLSRPLHKNNSYIIYSCAAVENDFYAYTTAAERATHLAVSVAMWRRASRDHASLP